MVKRVKIPDKKYLRRQGVKPARLMSIFNDLPRKWKFEFDPHFGILMPGLSLWTEVFLTGGGMFLFEQSEDPAVVNLNVTDVHLRLLPLMMPFDIDGDGVYEAVEVGTTIFGPECLDRKKCKGHINLATGEIKIHWAFNMKPSPMFLPELLPLMKKTDKKSFRIEVDDYGIMNFDDGTYTLNGGLFKLDEPAFQGMIIRGCGDSKLCGNDWIWLYGSLASKVKTCPRFVPQDYTKELCICRNDIVLLCWDSANVFDLSLSPGKHPIISPYGGYGNLLVRPGNSTSDQVTYGISAKYLHCDDSEGTISDYLNVNIYDGGWLPGAKDAYHALPDTNAMAWVCVIDEKYNSENILIEQIQIRHGEECLDWEGIYVKYNPQARSTTLPPSTYVQDYNEVDLSQKVPLPGQWFFYPTDKNGKSLDPHDYNKNICFRLKGVCTKK